jgi:hypothetical protein
MNTYELMMQHARKAIAAREAFYRGQDEAKGEWALSKREGTIEDFVQKFASSEKAKALIGDNRWHMTQAMMFGVMAVAHATGSIATELIKANGHLSRIADNTQHHTADGPEPGFRGPAYDEPI